MSHRTAASPHPVDGPVGWLALLAVIVGAHLTLAPKVAGLDSFYHLGHAAHYRAVSPFDTAFPWATQSIIRDQAADLWWGFHVLLMPFAGAGDPVLGIRAAGVLGTAFFAGCVVWALRRHGVAGAPVWGALALTAVPNVTYRLIMTRPHVLSLGLSLVLMSLLVRGRAWQVALVAAALSWIHLGLFWMAPGLAVAWVLVRFWSRGGGSPPDRADPDGKPGVDSRRPSPWTTLVVTLAATLAGTAFGALARPHPLGAVALAWTQIVELFAVKGSEAPLLFGVELQPLGGAEFWASTRAYLVLWLAATAWGVVGAGRPAEHGAFPAEPGASPAEPGAFPAARPRPDRNPGPYADEQVVLLRLSLVAAAPFLVLALLSARRALVEWTVLGFLALPLAATLALQGREPALRWSRGRRAGAAVLALGLALHLTWVARRHVLNVERVAFPPNVLLGASTWLEANAAPGDIVFHAHWDDFGPLFARNRGLRYLGGMDPIFQYAHDPSLYWEYFWLSTDTHGEWTCDAFPCYEGSATETHTAIRGHFGARWVVADRSRNPRLVGALEADPGFTVRLETGRETVFEVR